MTPYGFDWLREVNNMDDCIKQIYFSTLRVTPYENTYVGVLFCCHETI